MIRSILIYRFRSNQKVLKIFATILIGLFVINFSYAEHRVILSKSVKDFGALGNGKNDDTKAIQNALDYISKRGGGQLIIPNSSGDYLISGTLFIGSNTKLIFEDTFIKLIHYTKIGTILFNKPNATNIEIVNPKINGNNIYAGGTGENGISFGNGGTMTVSGGIIMNCRKGISHHKLGGKAIQVENKNVKHFELKGTKIINCSIALSSQFDILENQKINSSMNVVFSDVYAEKCGIFLLLIQVNGLVESHNFRLNLANFKTVDCGYEDGIFVFSRARNFSITNGIISGSKNIEAVIRGRHSQGSFSNITVNQDVNSIIDLQPSFHGLATTKAENNYYQMTINNKVKYILKTSPNYKYKFREMFNSDLNFILNNNIINPLLMPQAISNSSKISISNIKGKTLMKGNMIELFKEGKIK